MKIVLALCFAVALPAQAQEPAVARAAFTSAVRDREPVDRLVQAGARRFRVIVRDR